MEPWNQAEESVISPPAVHVPRDEKVTIEKRPEIDKNILDRQRGVNHFGNLSPLQFCESFSIRNLEAGGGICRGFANLLKNG